MAEWNAKLVVQNSTVYPFRVRGRALICVYCDEGYEDPAHFRRHVDCLHKKIDVSLVFAHVAKSQDHLKVDCTNLKCRLCGKPFSNIKDTAEHLSKEHASKINFDYDIALQCYKLDKGKWNCLLCDAKLANITNLCRHTVTTHYQKYTCDICGKTYLNMVNLKFHMKCIHSGKFPCNKCWKPFSTIEERTKHKQMSKSCWNFVCIYCRERFRSWKAKHRHLVEKHDCPEIKYPCPECDCVFKKRTLFNTHYRKLHSEKAYVCSFCKRTFSTRSELMVHRVIHDDEEVHKCPVCGKNFPKKSNLSEHMWIHSEVKRFECKLCNKHFNQKVTYKNHMKVHHSVIID